jgi:PAS domain S-box-containing protein
MTGWRVAALALLTAAYVGTATLGLTLAFVHEGVTLLWPPTGIALATLLLGGVQLWPGVAAGAFIANVWNGSSVAFALAAATGNTATAVAGALMLGRIGLRPDLERVRDVVGLIALGGASTAINASVGTGAIRLLGMAPDEALGGIWLTWWAGDTLGILLVAPVLLTWGARWRRRHAAAIGGRLEGPVFLLVVLVVSMLVYGSFLPDDWSQFLACAIFLFSLWGAVRLGQHWTVSGVLLGVGVAVWGTVRDLGPLALGPVQADLMMLAGFAVTATTATMVLGAEIAERRHGEADAARRAEQMGALAAVEGLLSQTLDARRVAQRVVDSLRTLLGAGATMVCELDERTGDLPVLALAADVGPAGDSRLVFRGGTDAVGLAVAERRPVQTPDVLEDRRVTVTADLREWTTLSSHRAALALPLIAHDRVIGALAVRAHRGRIFDEEDVALAQAFTDRAAMSLDRAMLAERERISSVAARRSEALLRTRLRLSGLVQQRDLDRLLQAALDAAEELTGSRIGYLHFVDADGQGLTLQTWSTNTLTSMCQAQGKGEHYPVSRAGVWVDCFHARAPVIHQDYASLPHRKGLPDGHAPIVRDLGVPIIRDDVVVAIIGVGNKASAYEPHDVEVVRELGAMVMDAVAMMRAEEAQRAGERRYRTLVESATDAVVCTDDTGRITLFNPAAERIFGYAGDEVLGREASVLAPPAVAGRNGGDIAGVLARAAPGVESTLELEARRKNGETFPVELSLSASAEGSRHSITAVIRDIGARHRAEEEIRKLYRAVEQSPVSVIVTDVRGDIEYVNPFFCEVTGYSREEVLGKNPKLLKSGAQSAEFYAELWETITSGRQWHGEFENRGKDGRCFREVAVISPVHDTTGRVTHFIAVKRDVTAERAHEQALEASRVQMTQVQKAEAIARLAGGIAHDFNNLLTVIIGRGDVALKHLAADGPQRHAVLEILKAAQRAAGLTRQLLAYSRRQVLEPRVLDLNFVLRDLSEMLVRLIGEDIELTLDLAPELGRVRVDRGQIEQVVMNLAVNARDAMPAGGKLTLSTSDEELSAGLQRGDVRPVPGLYVRLAVSDTGIGMSQEVIARVFEPFYTTKTLGKGTGLGLSVVYGIVKQSGGYIWAESVEGSGTVFEVFLPRAVAEAPEPPAPAAPPASQRIGACVLVIEDNDEVRELTREILESAGYRVIEAAGAEAALRMAEEHAGAIDLLLTDVVMPGLTGPELAARLSRVRPGVKVLFTSGYTADVMGVQHVLEGGFAFLPKPARPAELLARVAGVLAGTA